MCCSAAARSSSSRGAEVLADRPQRHAGALGDLRPGRRDAALADEREHRGHDRLARACRPRVPPVDPRHQGVQLGMPAVEQLGGAVPSIFDCAQAMAVMTLRATTVSCVATASTQTSGVTPSATSLSIVHAASSAGSII